MMNTIELIEATYDILNAAGIRSEINGGIYHQGQRPINSQKEDIVINVLSLTTEYTPQAAIVNVNIFVPDIDVKIGKEVCKVADESRLNTLAKLVTTAINDAVQDEADAYTSEEYLLQEEEIHQHYMNVRVSWTIH